MGGWIANLAGGLEAVVVWLNQSWLKLNPRKMEVLWPAKDNAVLGSQLPILDGMSLTSAQTVKSLGVTLDYTLLMKVQVSQAVKLTFSCLCQA